MPHKKKHKDERLWQAGEKLTDPGAKLIAWTEKAHIEGEQRLVNPWVMRSLTKFDGSRFDEFIDQVEDMVMHGNLRPETQLGNLKKALLSEIDRDLVSDIGRTDPNGMAEAICRLKNKYANPATLARKLREKAAQVFLPLNPGVEAWHCFEARVRALKAKSRTVDDYVRKMIVQILYLKIPGYLRKDLLRGRQESFESLLVFTAEEIDLKRRDDNILGLQGRYVRGQQTGYGNRGRMQGQQRFGNQGGRPNGPIYIW